MTPEELAHELFDVVTDHGPEWDTLCPVHDDSSPSCRVNPSKGVWFCHACHKGGTLESLAFERFGRNLHIDNAPDLEDLEAQLEELRLLGGSEGGPEADARRVYPEAWLNRFDEPHPYWTDPMPEGRGFLVSTVRDWRLGYDFSSHRVTYPLRDSHGGVLGVVYRKLDDSPGPKYQYPSGVRVADLLFGYHRVGPHESVALTEGALDAIALWEVGVPALAIYGSRLSDAQELLLRRLEPRWVLLAFDDDDAGHRAAERAEDMLDWVVTERFEYPPGHTDPASIPREQRNPFARMDAGRKKPRIRIR